MPFSVLFKMISLLKLCLESNYHKQLSIRKIVQSCVKSSRDFTNNTDSSVIFCNEYDDKKYKTNYELVKVMANNKIKIKEYFDLLNYYHLTCEKSGTDSMKKFVEEIEKLNNVKQINEEIQKGKDYFKTTLIKDTLIKVMKNDMDEVKQKITNLSKTRKALKRKDLDILTGPQLSYFMLSGQFWKLVDMSECCIIFYILERLISSETLEDFEYLALTSMILAHKIFNETFSIYFPLDEKTSDKIDRIKVFILNTDFDVIWNHTSNSVDEIHITLKKNIQNHQSNNCYAKFSEYLKKNHHLEISTDLPEKSNIFNLLNLSEEKQKEGEQLSNEQIIQENCGLEHEAQIAANLLGQSIKVYSPENQYGLLYSPLTQEPTKEENVIQLVRIGVRYFNVTPIEP